MAREKIIEPQPGPQELFLASTAQEVVYGGAAGGGKSYGTLLDPLRHKHNGKFRGVAFRRTMPEQTMAGGLFDTAQDLYLPLGAKSRESPGKMDIKFPGGWRMVFTHLDRDWETQHP